IVCMDVKVNDFTDIVEMQFSMNWDSTKFTFDHVEGFGLAGLDEMAFGTPLNSADHKEGRISVSWLDLSLNGVTLPDLTTIFRLCLKAKGAVGTGSAVNFTSDPLEIEVSTLDSVLVYGLIQGRAEIKQSCMGCSVSYGIDARNPLCRGAANGVIDLTVVEDCPENPTYVWNTTPPSTTEDLSGLAAGTYTVTITVGTQVIIASATLDDPAPFGSTVTITDPSPPGSATGAINITITGGTPPYHYQWSTPPGSTTEDISNLLAGTYSVTVTDNNGCTYVPNSFVVGADMTASVTNVSCNGGNNGAINLTVTFGTGPYTFNWNTTPPTTTEDLNNLVAGTYCVTVTDNGGSTRDSCFTITQPTALNVTATVTPDALQNCQGAIDLNVTGGTQPYSYLWSNAAPSQDLIGLCAGRYCVTVTDGNGCTVSQCFDITSGNFNVSLTAQQHNGYQTTCSGSCDGQVTSNVSGGTAPFTYHWGNNQSTANLNNLCAGTYALTVTDASGQTATASIVINAPPAITIDVTTTLPTDFNSNDGAASAIVNGGRPPYSYHWDGPVDFNTAAGSNLPGGTYILTVTDANGCEATKLVSLFPEGGPGCYQGISVITPNSDGKNDYFIISCVLDANNHLFIFNRAGGLVYETDNYQNNWIGVDQNNEPVPDGGYLWVLEVFGPNGSKILYKGTVVLLRTAD
ncbi:MAG TPA: gliding motility-associated C-terminal domain-containing protein, partial [Saprospiraceae bacterium]|nr:gliding motility-associated C-terminal domain-containing protein [Saprospiraceae bacterium]